MAHTTPEQAVPTLLEGDLATLEQRAQEAGRLILGRRIAAAVARRERARPRQLRGLVGDDRRERTYYCCGACGHSAVPLDAELGRGAGVRAPGLARVVARAAVAAPFAQAVDTGPEALGVAGDAEVARRATEGRGAVAEAQAQAAIARAGQGPEGWAPEERAVAEGTTTLAGGVDGGRVHRSADGPEMEVATLAPLGPERQAAPQSGRTHLAWGHASYGAGTEGAEDFGWRVRVEARRRGAPWPCWATGPSGSGGAPGTAVVEIVDIVRAYGYLRDVATAVGGAGTAAASAWVEPPKDRLYQQGAAPVLAALAALSPPPPPSAGAHPGYTPSAAGPDPVRPAVPPRTRLSAAPQTDRPAAPAPFAPLGVSDLCRGTPARINTEATVAIRTPR